MLRMVIADDEYIVRDGLKTIIPWSQLDIEIVGEAEDGQEAYDLCRNLLPDILLTDIRMPFYDGLEVAKMLRDLDINTKIIIISGYEDFSYAKTALNVNAESYILKPIKIDELMEVVKKVNEAIKTEKANAEKIRKMNNQLQENAAAIREKLFRDLIHGVYLEEKDIWEKIRNLSIPFSEDEKITVAILQIDDYNTSVENYIEENRQLLTFAVGNITEEIITTNQAGACLINSQNEFVIFFKGITWTNMKYIDICKEIVTCINRFLKASASIGIGSPKDSPKDLNISYNEAAIALQHRFYVGRNNVIDIKDVQLYKETYDYPNLYDEESRLIIYIKQGQSVHVTESINKIFTSFEKQKKPPVEYVKKVCFELVSVVSRVLFEFGENMDSITEPRPSIFDTILDIQELSALKDYIHKLFITISEYFAKKFTQKNANIINRIKDIINHHYRKDLSITEIANEVYLSPNYVSLLFKQETGITIIEYITGVRMEAAKELLGTTDFKVLEIAEMAGYENPHYFSTVFKKYTGMLPQNYRKLKQNSTLDNN